jgi:anti-anti-sigma regulatory factor
VAEPMKVRWIGGVAVLAVGPHAPGEPVPNTFSADTRGIVVDFAGDKLVSSVFLGHLVRAHRAAQLAGCRLCVCCPHAEGRAVLRAANLERVLPVVPTLGEALAHFDSQTD